MSYIEIVEKNQRLAILELLEKDAHYSQNETILRESLDYLGFTISTDLLHTRLQWLEEQGLITVETVGSLWIAKATVRGLEVSRGDALNAGVARPKP